MSLKKLFKNNCFPYHTKLIINSVPGRPEINFKLVTKRLQGKTANFSQTRELLDANIKQRGDNQKYMQQY